MDTRSVEKLYSNRNSADWRSRLFRWLQPPSPYIHNPGERDIDAPLGRWNLYIGGAGNKVDGYVNLDLFPLPGVNVAANAEQLPFRDSQFARVECDAVLEHAEDPYAIAREIERVLAPGGYAHIVAPFCHPFHEYPRDFRRFSPDGLAQLRGKLTIVKSGWRTGPTATLLVFILEYAKLWTGNRSLRAIVHVALGWLLFPFRYLDRPLFDKPSATRLGNHCYIWLRKDG